MARLDECWNCKKYRTSDCPGQYGLGTGCCHYYESNEEAAEEFDSLEEEVAQAETPTEKHSSVRNSIRIIIYVALVIFVVWNKHHSDEAQTYPVEENGEKTEPLFLVGKAPMTGRAQAEVQGMQIAEPIAWRLPEGFEAQKQKDGTVVYSRRDRYGTTMFTVEPFQRKVYDCNEFSQRWEGWKERLSIEKQCAGELYGSSNYTLLEGGRCFQWMGRSYNVPHTADPNDDKLFILGAVYLPEAGGGCYIYYISHSANDDVTYDIYHSVYALK